jgi:hypothetical protein
MSRARCAALWPRRVLSRSWAAVARFPRRSSRRACRSASPADDSSASAVRTNSAHHGRSDPTASFRAINHRPAVVARAAGPTRRRQQHPRIGLGDIAAGTVFMPGPVASDPRRARNRWGSPADGTNRMRTSCLEIEPGGVVGVASGTRGRRRRARVLPRDRRRGACSRTPRARSWSAEQPLGRGAPPEVMRAGCPTLRFGEHLVRARGRGSIVASGAGPVGRTSALSSKVTEAQPRRGVELAANDRNLRGQPLTRP